MYVYICFPGCASGEESTCQRRRWGSFPGVENGNSLQYSCLENFIDRGPLQARVHVVAKSWTQLSS